MNIYTVFDRIADEAGPPFVAKNDEVAKRMYKRLVKSDRVDPNEYRLLHIGTIKNSGLLEGLEIPVDIYVDFHVDLKEEEEDARN